MHPTILKGKHYLFSYETLSAYLLILYITSVVHTFGICVFFSVVNLYTCDSFLVTNGASQDGFLYSFVKVYIIRYK